MSHKKDDRPTMRMPAVRADEVRKVVAPTMSRAIRDARSRLGDRTVIISTKKISREGQNGYEVVAAPERSMPKVVEKNENTGSGTILRLQEELDKLERMARELSSQARRNDMSDLPPDLLDLFATLVDNEVEESLARALVRRVASESIGRGRGGRRGLLMKYIERLIPCSGPVVMRRGTTSVMALVGPTGAGKTTTVAKLAAHFRLRAGATVGLIAADTYKIGAREQLYSYARMIDLPILEANSPDEMRKALYDFHGTDLVLIDTAGSSHRDEGRLDSLRELILSANPDEVHLVVSATSQPRNLMAVLNRFAPLGARRLVFTKLDEAACMGAILTAVAKTNLPVSYVTTGQEVPSDIRPATPTELARLVVSPFLEAAG